MNKELPKELIQAVDCVNNALNELRKVSYKVGAWDSIPEHVGAAKGFLQFAVEQFEDYAPETDATPIDAETFDGDVFDDKKNAWIVAAAIELDFEFDYQEIAEEFMDEREDFTYIYDGVDKGTYEFGSDGWNECVMDFWTHDMDADDKAHYIIKKDSEENNGTDH